MPHLNYTLYDRVAQEGMKMPDIPVYAAASYAQCAEDLIVAALLRSLVVTEKLDLSTQTYLEIGANHPLACSATYLLGATLGMSGVLVEANPDLIAALERFRPFDRVVHAAVVGTEAETVPFYIARQDELSSLSQSFVAEWQGGSVGVQRVIEVQALHINTLLQTYWPETTPLYVSIDIEGCDLELVQSMDFARYRPAVVQVEPSEHHRAGNTLELVNCLMEQNYILMAQTDVNLIFVDFLRLGQSSQHRLGTPA